MLNLEITNQLYI